MNKQLETFARQSLKSGLSQLSVEQQFLFKRMYSKNNTGLTIEEVVDYMKVEQLDWAMEQVQRTLNKLTRTRPGPHDLIDQMDLIDAFIKNCHETIARADALRASQKVRFAIIQMLYAEEMSKRGSA